MQAGMGITDGIIQGKISCFRNKFHKHKEKCSEKRKFLGALCLRSEGQFLNCPCFVGLYTVTAATTGVAATTATAAGMSTAAATGRYRTVGARLVDKLCAWVIDLHLCI